MFFTQKVAYFFLDLGICGVCSELLSEETERGRKEKKKEQKNKKGAIFNSGVAAQPRRLAGHRAGTGCPPEKKATLVAEF